MDENDLDAGVPFRKIGRLFICATRRIRTTDWNITNCTEDGVLLSILTPLGVILVIRDLDRFAEINA